MSVNNFIPEVCAAEFQETLDRNLVFAEDCNRDYEGEVKKVGDAVRILGLGDAQTAKWTDGKLHRVDVDYQIEDTSMLMPINQISYWRFGIDDLDKRQAQSGNSLYSRWMQKENKRVARDMDEHIAGIHVGDLGVEVYEPKISGSVVPVSVDGNAGTDMPILTLMDEITQNLTCAAGYAQYEVSNYAKPGRACRHNIVYWACEPYLGVGLSAHSDMDGRRFYNPSDWADYMRMAESGTAERAQEGGNTREDRMFERMMMGLRQTQGVDCARFASDFGVFPEDVWPKQIARMKRDDLLIRDGDRLRLTARGMQVMNSVLVELL